MHSLTDDERQAALRTVGERKSRPDPLTEIRQGMRASLSFLHGAIAEDLNLSRAKVHGVVTAASAEIACTLQAEFWVPESPGPS